MSQQNNKQMVEELIAGIDAGDVSVMDEVFHDDAVMEWPQFGERIRGAQNRRMVYKNMPTLPKVTRRRIFGKDDLWIAEVLLDYDGTRFNTVLVFEFRDGKIAQETAYWATPSAPAEWRAQWVERI